eukprot:TRINITY_DN4816_c0_g1_i1.p1 TRINITY_DN4816_c0_g1~~TRINITY_DN4816_c0_g1_i1.p1  ORF type:complete len:486 (+),score=109.80 TRINITY_DN4816_c0_g1_i1:147-1604(+)
MVSLNGEQSENTGLLRREFGINEQYYDARTSQEKNKEPPQDVVLGTLYYTRFWVMLLFSVIGSLQSMIWITYSNLTKVSLEVYGIGDDWILILVALAAFIYIPVLPVSTWMIDRLGLRWSVLAFTTIQLVGSGVRIFAVDGSTFWWVVLGLSLNAIPGPIWMAGTTRLSNLWFGQKERTAATFFQVCFINSGVALSFIVSMFITNGHRLQMLVIIQTAVCAVALVLVLISFPTKPPTPPTLASALVATHESGAPTKISMWADTWKSLQIPSFLMINIIIGVTQGFLSGWNGALGTSLGPLGYDNDQIAIVGASCSAAGILAGVAILWVTNIKNVLIVLFIGATISFVWFQFVVTRMVYSTYAMVLVSSILGNMFMMATCPLSYELAVEIAYPVSEPVSTGILTLTMNIAALVFLGVGSGKLGFKPEGVTMNWCIIASLGLATFLMFFMKANYKRTKMDETAGTGKISVKRASKICHESLDGHLPQ